MRKLAILSAVLFVAVTIWFARPKSTFAQGSTPEVIALDEPAYNGTTFTLHVAFWYPITKNPTPLSGNPGSQWVASGSSAGATAAQVTAINNGTVKEEVESFTWTIGTPITAIEAELQTHWTARNAQLQGQGANQFYGDFFNGTAWAFQ